MNYDEGELIGLFMRVDELVDGARKDLQIHNDRTSAKKKLFEAGHKLIAPSRDLKLSLETRKTVTDALEAITVQLRALIAIEANLN